MLRNIISIVVFLCALLALVFILNFSSRGLGLFGFKLW